MQGGLLLMLAYLGSVWAYRYFWFSLVQMDLRARYRGSLLGIGWSLLHPVAMTVIICAAFSTVLGADLRTYAPFLMAGLTLWNYLTTVSLLGSHTFFQAEAYIRQHPAPLAIYPLRTMLGNAFHGVLAFGLVLLLGFAFRGFPGLLPLLSLIPTFALLMVLGWSLSTFFGLINVRFGDARHVSEIGFQALFYLTPIIYEPDLLVKRGLGFLLRVNPVVPFLDLVRQPILEGMVPSPATYALASLLVLASFLVAAALLRYEERRLIFLL
jgi:ABC-type polysaccharide/polyol phosphate export permease